MYQLVSVLLLLGQHSACWEIGRRLIVYLDRRVLVTIRSGYARFEHGNCSFRSRPAESVNSPVDLPHGFLGILKLAIIPTPCGRIIGDSRSCKGLVPFGVLREARSRFRVFGGVDSTAPPCGRACRRHPAPQQYFTDHIVCL